MNIIWSVIWSIERSISNSEIVIGDMGRGKKVNSRYIGKAKEIGRLVLKRSGFWYWGSGIPNNKILEGLEAKYKAIR